MKIEELPHIDIERKRECNSWASIEVNELYKKFGYIPIIDALSGTYSIISRLLDKDCVVAYYTDNSQTTFLIKTRRMYVPMITLSKRLYKYLASYGTRKITRMKLWNDEEDRFIEYSNNEDLIIVDEDLWGKYIKTKLLDNLSK